MAMVYTPESYELPVNTTQSKYLVSATITLTMYAEVEAYDAGDAKHDAECDIIKRIENCNLDFEQYTVEIDDDVENQDYI